MKFQFLGLFVASSITFAATTFAQTVRIGTNEYPVIFDDATLPEINRELIACDLADFTNLPFKVQADMSMANGASISA